MFTVCFVICYCYLARSKYLKLVTNIRSQ